MSFFRRREEPQKPTAQIQVGEEQPHNIYLNRNMSNSVPADEKTPFAAQQHVRTLFDVGIFRDTLAPSLALHGGLAVIAYGIGRTTDRVDAKDWLWPAAPVINAWWSAIGKRVFIDGAPISSAFNSLSWVERLLLTGVTLWGGRLFYRIATRSLKRGRDDDRYTIAKQEEGFWNKSLFKTFLPEAIFQTIITLPFTAPFRHQGAVLTGYHPIGQAAAVALFSTGFTLETLADYQLDKHNESPQEGGLLREGVWSLCRHPNYLGDALVHFSFPLMLYSSDMLAPVELLGAIANYSFLRYIGGDRQKETHQKRRYSESNPVKMGHLEKYQEDKNAFWPTANEVSNKWTWIVLGAGAAGIAVERAFNVIHHL